MWIEETGALERELHCRYRAEPLEGEFLDIVKGQLPIVENNEADGVYHSFWFVIRKADRVVMSSACFKGAPNVGGEVEIGYGLVEAFEHQGYMTETVAAMCDWALMQPNVERVIAETDADNPKSHNVLKRCGFSCYEQGDMLWWRLP